MYANTHTETSATGLQTTMFRREAREMVARSVNATVGARYSCLFSQILLFFLFLFLENSSSTR